MAGPSPASVPAPMRDKLVLLLALLVLWQILASVAGPQVLTTPLATLRRLASLMAEAICWMDWPIACAPCVAAALAA